jgi:hypothetical protein
MSDFLVIMDAPRGDRNVRRHRAVARRGGHPVCQNPTQLSEFFLTVRLIRRFYRNELKLALLIREFTSVSSLSPPNLSVSTAERRSNNKEIDP